MILTLALKSLRMRRVTAALTVLSIALAVALLVGVERLRAQSREAFAGTVSGTDLVVGARTSPVHLLLFSVFRIGDPGNNVRWETWRAIAARPDVAWTIPVSLGDSVRGFRVLGTTPAYFEHFRHGRNQALAFAQGGMFSAPRDAVLGADVAEALRYAPGQTFVIAHGTGDLAGAQHAAFPFRVAGVLARTGTPVDRTVHVPLDGLDLVHAEGGAGATDPLAGALAARAARTTGDAEHDKDAGAREISAVLVGLKNRAAALSVQRALNAYPGEPLTALLPGVTLLEVWEIASVAERALGAVSLLVLVAGLAGLLIALLTSVGERRREMAVLRSVGARPVHVFGLVLGEAMLLAAAGAVLGMAALTLGLAVGAPWLQAKLGFAVGVAWPTPVEAGLLLLVVAAAVLAAAWPAWRTYRFALVDGLSLRL